MNSFSIDRNKRPGRHRLSEIFKGLSDSPALIELMYDEKERNRVLNETIVEITTSEGYMYVSDDDGRLVVGNAYLKEASEEILYLDVVHELVHVKQYHNGADLYDSKYSYVDRPTEIEAYRLAVKEARRLGWIDLEIADYLLVDWITKEQRDRLARTLGVRIESRGRRKPRL